MIIKGQVATEAIKREFNKIDYKDIEWFSFDGYIEYPKVEDSNWNKDYFAKTDGNNLEWFIEISYEKFDKSINLYLYISKNNKDNFFKILNYIKKFIENNFNFDIVYFKVARKNEKMINIVKTLYKRYDNLYFLRESLSNNAKSILGNESSFLEFAYITRNKEKYLNDFVLNTQLIFKYL